MAPPAAARGIDKKFHLLTATYEKQWIKYFRWNEESQRINNLCAEFSSARRSDRRKKLNRHQLNLICEIKFVSASRTDRKQFCGQAFHLKSFLSSIACRPHIFRREKVSKRGKRGCGRRRGQTCVRNSYHHREEWGTYWKWLIHVHTYGWIFNAHREYPSQRHCCRASNKKSKNHRGNDKIIIYIHIECVRLYFYL